MSFNHIKIFPEDNPPLLEQLYAVDRALGSYAFVIGQTSKDRLKGIARNDFVHCEAVLHRLSQILPDASQFGLNSIEIFALVASAFLHDIGKAKGDQHATHGNLSADIIEKDQTLRDLFPADDLRSQVQRICDYHDRKKIREIEQLPQIVSLDVRPHSNIKPGERIRLRMVAAIFRLADELECISDRLRGEEGRGHDPRSYISAIRIYLEARSIFIDFSRGADKQVREDCMDYLTGVLEGLDDFLRIHTLAFKLVDNPPELSKKAEEKKMQQEQRWENIKNLEKERITAPSLLAGWDFDLFCKTLEQSRMRRLRSVNSLSRGRRYHR
jgi:hypothetical protein